MSFSGFSPALEAREEEDPRQGGRRFRAQTLELAPRLDGAAGGAGAEQGDGESGFTDHGRKGGHPRRVAADPGPDAPARAP